MKQSPSSSSPVSPSSTASQNRSRFQIATPANSESMDEENNSSMECQQGSVNQSFDQEKDYLRPPAPKRQFLLSPPPSPPVGWEPPTEAQPMINYELLAAISQMVPGQPLQLHPPEQDKPAIVVHICEDSDPIVSSSSPTSCLFSGSGIRIPQTQRPPVKCAAPVTDNSQSNQSATTA